MCSNSLGMVYLRNSHSREWLLSCKGLDMAKEYAKGFYNSSAWIKCREGYIKSTHDGLCERCKTKNRIKPGKIVHHIKEITPLNINDTGITLNWDNLEYVCQDCHNLEHHGAEDRTTTEEGLMFDGAGRLVIKEC